MLIFNYLLKKRSIFAKTVVFNILKIKKIPNLIRYPLAFFQKHKNEYFCLLNFDRFSPFNSKLKSCRKSKFSTLNNHLKKCVSKFKSLN